MQFWLFVFAWKFERGRAGGVWSRLGGRVWELQCGRFSGGQFLVVTSEGGLFWFVLRELLRIWLD